MLFVTQTQSFTSIKAELLEAIQSIGIHDINGDQIPTSSDDIVLGVPVDKNDLSNGWVDLEMLEREDDEESGSKMKGVKKNSVLNASPQGAGLKDGAMLAFKFRRHGDEDESNLGGDDWDVIIPSYDDEDANPNGT